MKRTLALFLALMTLALGFTACGETSVTPEETTVAAVITDAESAEQTAEEDTTPVFNDADYQKHEFLIYQRSETASSYKGLYIDTEDVSDTISSAVFKRNSETEEKYNIVITARQTDDPYKTVETDVATGTVDYDMILDRRNQLASLSRKGVLANWNDLNIDFSRPWWDSNAAEQYEICGKLYMMVNDVSVGNLSGARFPYFNKRIVKEYNLTDPYELISKNEWTLENFLAMIKGVSAPAAEGLGTYGMAIETGASNGVYMHLLAGCGVVNTSVNADGTFYTEANSEKTQNVFEKISTVFNDKSVCITFDEAVQLSPGTLGKYDQARLLFAEGHFLFIEANMGVANQFADMEDDYGVVPNPKYDSDQESYWHKMDKYSIIWAIPEASTVDKTMVANVADYWAYRSSETVMPAYYEITIKTKRVQESTASENLDIIKDSIMYDLGDVYGITTNDALNAAYSSGNIASTWKSYQKAITTAFEKLYNDFQ